MAMEYGYYYQFIEMFDDRTDEAVPYSGTDDGSNTAVEV